MSLILNKTDNFTNLISFLFFIGLGLNLAFVYYAQERLYNEMTYGDLSLGSEGLLRIFSVILIFITVILSLFDARKKYLYKIFFTYVLLLVIIIINYLITSPDLGDLTNLMDLKGIGPWVCFGLIFVGFDDKRYNVFKIFLFISVITISLFVIYNLLNFGVGQYRGQALALYRVYAVNLVWLTPFVFLILKNNQKLVALRVYALLIGIVVALVTQTRSFLLIYILVLGFDFYYTRKKVYYTIGISIIGLLFVYMLLNAESLSSSFELLLKRGSEDSRSNQLTEFLSQLDFFEVVVGKGFNATWYSGGHPYPYLDNQWLLLIWWAGLIPAVLYFYLTTVIPVKLFFRKNQDYETKVESFILIIWTLACAGLAIYTSITIDFFFFIICVIQGRLLYKYSQTYEY